MPTILGGHPSGTAETIHCPHSTSAAHILRLRRQRADSPTALSAAMISGVVPVSEPSAVPTEAARKVEVEPGM